MAAKSGCYYLVPDPTDYSKSKQEFIPLVKTCITSKAYMTIQWTKVDQTYVNNSDKPISKVNFRFPRFAGHTVVGFTCTHGHTRLDATVRPASEVDTHNREMMADKSILRGAEKSDLKAFTTTIMKIAGRERIQTSITYINTIEQDHVSPKNFRVTFPASIASHHEQHVLNDKQPSEALFQVKISFDVGRGNTISRPFFVRQSDKLTNRFKFDAKSQTQDVVWSHDRPFLKDDLVFSCMLTEAPTSFALIEDFNPKQGAQAIMASLICPDLEELNRIQNTMPAMSSGKERAAKKAKAQKAASKDKPANPPDDSTDADTLAETRDRAPEPADDAADTAEPPAAEPPATEPPGSSGSSSSSDSRSGDRAPAEEDNEEFSSAVTTQHKSTTLAESQTTVQPAVVKTTPPAGQPSLKEVVFVCDRSESMIKPGRMETAITAASLFVASLRGIKGAKVNFYSIGGSDNADVSTRPFFYQSQECSDETIDQLKRYVLSFKQPKGVADFGDAFEMISHGRLPHHHLDIVLLTGAKGWGLDLLEKVQSHCAASKENPIRIFTLGLGNVVSRPTLQRFAQVSNGLTVTSSRVEDVPLKMMTLYAAMTAQTVRMGDISLVYTNNTSEKIVGGNIRSTKSGLSMFSNFESAAEPIKAMGEKAFRKHMTEKRKEAEKNGDPETRMRLERTHQPHRVIQSPTKLPLMNQYTAMNVFIMIRPENRLVVKELRFKVWVGSEANGVESVTVPVVRRDNSGECRNLICQLAAVNISHDFQSTMVGGSDDAQLRWQQEFTRSVLKNELLSLGIHFGIPNECSKFVTRSSTIDSPNMFSAVAQMIPRVRSKSMSQPSDHKRMTSSARTAIASYQLDPTPWLTVASSLVPTMAVEKKPATNTIRKMMSRVALASAPEPVPTEPVPKQGGLAITDSMANFKSRKQRSKPEVAPTTFELWSPSGLVHPAPKRSSVEMAKEPTVFPAGRHVADLASLPPMVSILVNQTRGTDHWQLSAEVAELFRDNLNIENTLAVLGIVKQTLMQCKFRLHAFSSVEDAACTLLVLAYLHATLPDHERMWRPLARGAIADLERCFKVATAREAAMKTADNLAGEGLVPVFDRLHRR